MTAAITRVDFAPGHEGDGLTQKDCDRRLLLMRAGPRLLQAARIAERVIRAERQILLESYGTDDPLGRAGLVTFDHALAQLRGAIAEAGVNE